MDKNLFLDFLREKKRLNLPEEISEQEKYMLLQGVPFQKIIGFINFDNLQINVNRYVLIPRYETYEVIEFASKYINSKSKVLDLCAGSGVIGLMLKQKTNADVTLSDIDNESIIQIGENARMNNLDVNIVKSDLFENINEKFDVIVSNPPYVENDYVLPDSISYFEPKVALFADIDGCYFYEKIIQEVNKYLHPNGIIIFEIGPKNSEFVKKHGFEIIKDINGKDRIAFKQYK